MQANLPGASPETMAASVATILERQFSTVPGLDSMTSSSVRGNTSITMQFVLDRNIDAASQDMQSAIAAVLPPAAAEHARAAQRAEGEPGRSAHALHGPQLADHFAARGG